MTYLDRPRRPRGRRGRTTASAPACTTRWPAGGRWLAPTAPPPRPSGCSTPAGSATATATTPSPTARGTGPAAWSRATSRRSTPTTSRSAASARWAPVPTALPLSGRVDRIDRRACADGSGDELVIVDYKTGRRAAVARRCALLDGTGGLRRCGGSYAADPLAPGRAAPPAHRRGARPRAHARVARPATWTGPPRSPSTPRPPTRPGAVGCPGSRPVLRLPIRRSTRCSRRGRPPCAAGATSPGTARSGARRRLRSSRGLPSTISEPGVLPWRSLSAFVPHFTPMRYASHQ